MRAAIRFLDAVESVVERIAVAPEEFPAYEGYLRRAVVRHFPFYLVFRADDASVIVFAVAHAKRKPSYWRNRT